MSTKHEANELEKTKLTTEEIQKHKEFEDLSDKDLDNLQDFIFELSTIIINSYENK